MLKVNIIKSKRKTLTLTVDINGNVIIKSPIGLSEQFINDWVASKASWIQHKLSNIKQRRIYYYGNPYNVEILENTPNIVTFTGNKFVVAQDFASKQHVQINKWLRREATKYIPTRINEISKTTGLKFNKLTIKDTKTRWGSCSFHNNININWKVIMMDKELIDYILIHELCHTVVKNHSQDFWNQVRIYIPNLNVIKLRLKVFEKSQQL